MELEFILFRRFPFTFSMRHAFFDSFIKISEQTFIYLLNRFVLFGVKISKGIGNVVLRL